MPSFSLLETAPFLAALLLQERVALKAAPSLSSPCLAAGAGGERLGRLGWLVEVRPQGKAGMGHSCVAAAVPFCKAHHSLLNSNARCVVRTNQAGPGRRRWRRPAGWPCAWPAQVRACNQRDEMYW